MSRHLAQRLLDLVITCFHLINTETLPALALELLTVERNVPSLQPAVLILLGLIHIHHGKLDSALLCKKFFCYLRQCANNTRPVDDDIEYVVCALNRILESVNHTVRLEARCNDLVEEGVYQRLYGKVKNESTRNHVYKLITLSRAR
jgi:hypothetical protein